MSLTTLSGLDDLTAIVVLTAKSLKKMRLFYVLLVLTGGVALTAIVVLTTTTMEKLRFFFVLVVDRGRRS